MVTLFCLNKTVSTRNFMWKLDFWQGLLLQTEALSDSFFFLKTKEQLGQVSLYSLRLASKKDIGNQQYALFVCVTKITKYFQIMNIIYVVVIMSSYCHFLWKVWKHVLTCKLRLPFSHEFLQLFPQAAYFRTEQLMG